MSNTFWAVLFGSALGNLIVQLTIAVVDEYRAKQRHHQLHHILDRIEDIELEEYEFDEED